MSYPEPRYFGDAGEVSARYRPADHEPELTSPAGTTTHYLATGASTHGLFGLYRVNMGPQPSGPGPHFHRTITESFFILSGTVRIYDGRQWIDTQPGVPEGGIHGFRNESGKPPAMLLHFSPGAPREAYFEAQVDVPGMTDEEKAAFYLRHDNFWL